MAVAKPIYEKRTFTNRQAGGEIVEYEFYGIQGVGSDGEIQELRLQNLNSAEKIAFKMMTAMGDPIKGTVTASRGGEVDVTRTKDESQDTPDWLKD